MIDIPYKYRLLILCAIAFLATMLVFRPILKIAKSKDIVDAPGERKLQKTPIPVMGGIAVFFGIIVGLCFFKTLIVYTSLFPVIGGMMIMLYIGGIDDCIGIKPSVRLVVEMLVCLLICYGNKMCINNFQGFLGFGVISHYVGIPLAVLTFLGIVNSINMIDGVDGLSSGICIFILSGFGLLFFLAHDFSYCALAAVSIGALLPFLLHNVFGYKTKMFIGDSGTMMIATAISAMVIRVMNSHFDMDAVVEQMDFGTVGVVLALLAIPVADTLRVMIFRVKRHKSPFEADKNHFHHILIRLHFSYIAISITEIVMAAIVLAAFLASWLLGAGVNMQVVVVVGTAAVLNWGLAAVLNRALESESGLYTRLVRFGDWTHVERTGLWYRIQCIIDREK